MPSMAQVRAVCFKLGEKTEPSRVLKHILEWLSTGCPMLSCSRRAIVIRRVPEEQLVPLSLSLSLMLRPGIVEKKEKSEKEKEEGREEKWRVSATLESVSIHVGYMHGLLRISILRVLERRKQWMRMQRPVEIYESAESTVNERSCWRSCPTDFCIAARALEGLAFITRCEIFPARFFPVSFFVKTESLDRRVRV